jgi:hypothetical protein
MNRTHTVAKALSTHISIILTQVSVPKEDRSQQSSTFTHALKGSRTCVPHHAPSGPVLSYLCQVLQAKHKHQNPHRQQKKDIHIPNSSIKVTNNKIRLSTTK